MVTGTNDQYAGALGAGNCRPGILTETTGTCLALVTLFENTPDLPQKSGVLETPGLMTGRFPIEGYGFALAYAKTAGLVVDWFRRQFAEGHSLAQLEALAAASPIGSRGVTVLPHFDGMVSPHPNAASRGAFLNLTLGHTLGDMYRAVLESIAFSLRENVELMQHSGLTIEAVRAIGGGARSDLWLQIKADVTGVPIERPAITEAATLGAAMLAAVGAGEFGTVAECSATFYHAGRVFSPDAARQAQYERPYRAYRELYRKLYGN
jgi:xylulokinase